MEFVQANCYRRTIEVGDAAGVIDVKPDVAEPRLVVLINLPTNESLIHIVERVRRMFDLGADPLQIETRLSADSGLRTLVEMRPGLRVPGAWDGFEVVIGAILGQGQNVVDGDPRAERLVRAFGKPLATSLAGLTHLFPRPEVLADADLSTAGIRGTEAATIRAVARAVCAKELTFQASRTLEDTISRLCTISGVGESMAHYIAMRAFGEPDAFPSADTGLGQSPGDEEVSTSPADMMRMAEQWRPWRAYAVMHLWAESRRRDVRRRVQQDLYSVMNARLVGDPVAPRIHNPNIPPGVEEIILHALARDDDRYRSAAAMRCELAAPEVVPVTGRADRLKAPPLGAVTGV